MKLAALAVVGIFAVAGCGGSEKRPEFPEPSSEDDPAAGRVEVTHARPAASGAGLTRARLNQFLDAGPASFLHSVRVKPSLIEDRFAGWEILSIEDPSLAGGGLLPGDVVVAANGKSLEHPEELGYLFEILRSAPELVVSYRRAGAERVLRVPIIER